MKLKKLLNPDDLLFKGIERLPDQILQVFSDFDKLSFPAKFKKLKKIIFCGMGGSALGARVVKALTKEDLKLPFEIVNDYTIPRWANEDCLVIISSYSGNTEETISCLKEALAKDLNVFILTTGGKIKDLGKKLNLCGYIFNPIHNVTGQPRNAIFYSIFSVLALFDRLSIYEINKREIERLYQDLKKYTKYLIEDEKDLFLIFSHIKSKIPVFIGGDFLIGVAHVLRNLFNETAKRFSVYFDLPELNHHLLEGLILPSSNREYLFFVFLNSEKLSPKLRKRLDLTFDVVRKNKIDAVKIDLAGKSKLEEVARYVVYGNLLCYFLAKQDKVDPLSIPWVDYFKKKLRG